jgi:hypothetical protein
MKPKERLEALVDTAVRSVTSMLIVQYGLRMLPSTIHRMREIFQDAVGAAKRLGELRDHDDGMDGMDSDKSINETVPGFRHHSDKSNDVK